MTLTISKDSLQELTRQFLAGVLTEQERLYYSVVSGMEIQAGATRAEALLAELLLTDDGSPEYKELIPQYRQLVSELRAWQPLRPAEIKQAISDLGAGDRLTPAELAGAIQLYRQRKAEGVLSDG